MPAVMPATTRGGGMCMAMPDTCLVPAPPAPPVPTPFPNIAQCMDGNPGTCALKAKFMNQPPLLANSMIMQSSGDEAGSAGGVMSGMIKGPGTIKKGSMKVSVEGKPVCMLTAMVAQNGASANAPPGVQMAPSQTMIMVDM